MAEFSSGHGLHYFLPQSYISKRTIFGSKPWLYCELALDRASDVVPTARFSPKGHIPGKRSASEGTLSQRLRKRMICIIHSQQVAIPANCSCSAKAPMAGGGRHLGPFRHKPMHPNYIQMFPVALGCYSELRSGIPPRPALTVPEDSFQTLPIPSLSQQVFRHRWKKGILKSQKSRAGFSLVNTSIHCRCSARGLE